MTTAREISRSQGSAQSAGVTVLAYARVNLPGIFSLKIFLPVSSSFRPPLGPLLYSFWTFSSFSHPFLERFIQLQVTSPTCKWFKPRGRIPQCPVDSYHLLIRKLKGRRSRVGPAAPECLRGRRLCILLLFCHLRV